MPTKNYPLIKKRISEIQKELKVLSKKGIKKEVPEYISREMQDNISYLGTQIYNFKNSKAFNFHSIKEKFFTTIGIEYTFLKRFNSKEKEVDICNKLIKLSDKRQTWNKQVHGDGIDVIEFASPVHKNWKDMLENYRNTVKLAKDSGLVLKRKDCGSGGGHIHMGLPKAWTLDFKLRFLKVFYADINLRPYLNWVFNESIDDGNASSMFTDYNGAKFMMTLFEPRYFSSEQIYRDSQYIDFNTMHNLSTKNFALRYDNEFDTVELRIFDMMENEKMLEDYVEFANAYFRFIYYLTLRGYSWNTETCEIDLFKEYTPEDYKKPFSIPNTLFDRFKNKKKTIERFEKFLDILGLDKKKYRKYIKKNYEERLKLSKVGDVKMDYDTIKSFVWPERVFVNSEENVDGKYDNLNSASDHSEDIVVNIRANNQEDISIEAFEAFNEVTTSDSLESSEVADNNSSGEVFSERLEVRPALNSNQTLTTSNELTTLSGVQDPLRRIRVLSRIIAEDLLKKMEETPRNGQKITISTTW